MHGSSSLTATRTLMELVGEAYGFADLDEFRPGVLELLDRVVPSTWASYNEVGTTPDRVFSVVVPTFPESLVDVFARLAHENPLIVAYRQTGDGRPRRFSDVVDREAYHALDLYRECYRPLGVESQVAFTLPARSPLVLGIALCRGEEDFDDEELELLGLVRPHLIQAYRNAELSGRRAAVLRTLEAGLETVGSHVVVLDPHGRVEFATDRARELLGIAGPGGAAPAAAIGDWIRERRRGRSASAEPLILEGGGRPVLVRLLPRGTGDRRDVLIVEAGAGELTVDGLRELGLTRREAETLRWVALGATASVAARRMGIAPRTADKHLQHVYAKLGVASAAQAVATAWAGVGFASQG